MKTTLFFLVLVAALVLADSEQRIDNCNKDEIELRTWKVSCSTSLANYRAALAEKTKYDALYLQAARSFDFAVGEFVVAEKEEHLRLAEKNAATSVYNLARKNEDALCNNLVRNVDPKTPCARLLNRARKNNRLVQCRAAKVTLAQAEKILAERTTVYNLAYKNLQTKTATKIAKLKLREEANAIRLQKEAIFQLRLSSKNVTCVKYRDLRTKFYGKTQKYELQHGSFGYRAFKNKGLNWEGAEAHCAKRGGHLISIHNNWENDVAIRLCGRGQNVQIGLKRNNRGEFVWSDGSAFDYRGWAPGQPQPYNEPVGEEITTGGETGKWHDYPSRTLPCFVCKYQIKSGDDFDADLDN